MEPQKPRTRLLGLNETQLRRAAYSVSALAVAVCAGLVVVAWLRVDAPVPVHWDAQLRPDRYGSKEYGLLLPLAGLLLVVSAFRFASTRSCEPGPGRAAGYVMWLAAVAPLGILQAITIFNTAFDRDFATSPLVLPSLVAVALVVATYANLHVVAAESRSAAETPVGRPRYWFKAKRWGWGWSRPSTWEGWVAMVVYGAAVSAPLLGAAWAPVGAVGLLGGTPVLLWLCVKKGEPARWRWGSRD